MIQSRTNFPRAISPVNRKLNRQLMAYAAAATAAGVGLLSAPQTAEAKIVYTPTNVSIGVGGSLPIDLNNDGTPDFEVLGFSCEHSTCLAVNPLAAGNGIKGRAGLASAGAYGLPVGPKGPFIDNFYSTNGGHRIAGFMADESSYGSGGPWANTTNRYLGLRFSINGKVHYGWARLSVRMSKNSIVLTGFAYETIPNHGILEGHSQGLNASDLPPTDLLTPVPQAASLGALACGTDGLSIWRREDEAIARR